MTENQPTETGIGRERARRTKFAFGVQVPGLVIVGLLLLYFGLSKIAKGQDVAMWIAVLAVYAVATGTAVWLMRRAVESAKD